MFKGSSEIAPVKGKLLCGQYFPFQRKEHSGFQIIRKKQYFASVELEKQYKKEQGNGLLDNCYIETLYVRFLGYLF